MKHKLISVTNIHNLIEKIDETIENEFLPTLAFIYASVSCNIPSLFNSVQKYSFDIVGASTVGEIHAVDEKVCVDDYSIVCMLVDIKDTYFKVKVENIEKDFYTSGKNLSLWAKHLFENPALLTITAGLSFDNEHYIEGLQTELTELFGASAGDDNNFQDTYVFSKEKVINSGAIVLAFDQDKMKIINTRGFGWYGIGTQRVVTNSHNNVVFTIDDKPAINFYKDYLNITMDDMPEMGANHPLEVVLNNGQVVYRTPVFIAEDGSLVFAGHVKEGSKVRISAPIGEAVIDEVEMSIRKALDFQDDFQGDFTLIFPCAAHKNLLGTYGIKEIEAVYSATKQSPLIGFYAYGEISSSTKSNAFHNETFVTVQLRER